MKKKRTLEKRELCINCLKPNPPIECAEYDSLKVWLLGRFKKIAEKRSEKCEEKNFFVFDK